MFYPQCVVDLVASCLTDLGSKMNRTKFGDAGDRARAPEGTVPRSVEEGEGAQGEGRKRLRVAEADAHVLEGRRGARSVSLIIKIYFEVKLKKGI